MTESVKIYSPIDGRMYAERPVASGVEIEAAVAKAKAARRAWGEVTVRERAKFLEGFWNVVNWAEVNKRYDGR